jgi:hypothetical protein
MVQSSVVFALVASCLLFNCAFALDKNKADDDDQKSVKKRGIIHLGIHPHINHVPHFHQAPHFHQVPHVHVPRIPVVTKIPIGPTVFAKPFLPPSGFLPAPIPVTPPLLPAPVHPYHITPGDATVTSFSATYPRFPVYTKTIVPAVLPHHHHHHNHFDPHFHVAKPIIPVAVPFPGIRQPKYPVFFNPSPIRPHYHPITPHYHPISPHYHPISPHYHPISPHFHPIAPAPPISPTFVPIPIPSNPPTTINTPAGILSSSSTSSSQQTEQVHHSNNNNNMVPQGSWRPIIMLTKPSQASLTTDKHHMPFNFHATLSQQHQNIPTNSLISGQGTVSSHLAQLALYQHHQNLLSEQQQQQQGESRECS